MSRPLVYVIDDDVELSKVIERRFLTYGCEVRCFTEPVALFAAFQERRPKLMMVDLNLGDGLSGFDIVEKIRNGLKADLPVLILSGDKDQKNIAHALELGANDYIVKPPLRLDFEEILSHYLKTDRLSEPTLGIFQGVNSEKNKSKLVFQVCIEEVHSAGLTLLSDHLIKKETSFYLRGPELKKITPGCETIFVRVIGSATKIVNEQKKYQIQLEFDSSQEQALREVRSFLASKFNQQKSK